MCVDPRSSPRRYSLLGPRSSWYPVHMEHPIVVAAVDLGQNVERVIATAAANAKGGKLVIAHVLPELLLSRPLFPQLGTFDAERTLALTKAVQTQLSEVVRRMGIRDHELVLKPGDPCVEVVGVAEQHGANLVVVGAPSDPSRWLSGTAEKIVRYASCPVLVRRTSGVGPVVAATDLSDPSLPAIVAGVELAAKLEVPLRLLHVVDYDKFTSTASLAASFLAGSVPSIVSSPELERLAKETLTGAAALHAPDAKTEVLVGIPVDEIVKYATRLDASAIVVGTRGRTGFDRVFIGSVAESVIRQASCSVLVVRQVATKD